MSFNKIAAALAFLALMSNASASPLLSCPHYKHGMKLSAYSVFDGNPANKADLRGDDTGWDLSSPPFLPGESYHLVCIYQRDKLDLVIPATIKHCEAQGTTLSPAIACH